MLARRGDVVVDGATLARGHARRTRRTRRAQPYTPTASRSARSRAPICSPWCPGRDPAGRARCGGRCPGRSRPRSPAILALCGAVAHTAAPRPRGVAAASATPSRSATLTMTVPGSTRGHAPAEVDVGYVAVPCRRNMRRRTREGAGVPQPGVDVSAAQACRTRCRTPRSCRRSRFAFLRLSARNVAEEVVEGAVRTVLPGGTSDGPAHEPPRAGAPGLVLASVKPTARHPPACRARPPAGGRRVARAVARVRVDRGRVRRPAAGRDHQR